MIERILVRQRWEARTVDRTERQRPPEPRPTPEAQASGSLPPPKESPHPEEPVAAKRFPWHMEATPAKVPCPRCNAGLTIRNWSHGGQYWGCQEHHQTGCIGIRTCAEGLALQRENTGPRSPARWNRAYPDKQLR